jgi:hypothetical protein
LKSCQDALNELHTSLNEIDRNEYASHIRFEFLPSPFSILFKSICSSVEHHIADMKQRLNHLKQLSIEHQTEYKNFEKNLQLFQFDVDKSKQTIPTRLMQITVEDIRIIDVSPSLSKIYIQIKDFEKSPIHLNARATLSFFCSLMI